MAIGGTFLIIGLIVAVIWIFVELKRFRHKIWAVFLIALILFSYFGFVIAIKDKGLNLKSVDGLRTAGKLYWGWLGTVFKNTKTITGNIVNLDWTATNVTTSEN